METKVTEDRPADNPLREGLPELRVPAPCAIVIFGASGDLVSRKLIPALWSLHVDRLLPDRLSIIGVARTEQDDSAFRDQMHDAVSIHSERATPEGMLWQSFAERLQYLSGNYDSPGTYAELKERVSESDRIFGTAGNRLYYLATPPQVFPLVLSGLDESGLARNAYPGAFNRVVIEKPFGADLEGAVELEGQAVSVFGEEDVYRIDHYLGKETVQNIMIFRFANGIFEPLWNRRYIDHVQITAAESDGIGGRAGYYDQAGVLRDMFQNHMLQLLCLVAMEPPTRFDAAAVNQEKLKIIEAVRPVAADEVGEYTVRAQYGEGAIAGDEVAGYRAEPGVPDDSATETYAALKLHIDNWRFAGVPFYLRSGKRLAKRATEISVQFRAVPHMMFRAEHDQVIAPNVLTMRLQPEEGISLSLEAKVPGLSLQVRPVHMDFRYGTAFGGRSPEAYQRLLLDALTGDRMLFPRGDWLASSWELIDPILEGWRSGSAPLATYQAGSWGPDEADAFLESDGRKWRRT